MLRLVQEKVLVLLCSSDSASRQMINNWEYFQPHFKWEIKNHYESVRPLETLMLPFF